MALLGLALVLTSCASFSSCVSTISPVPKRRLDLFPLKLSIDLARGLRLSGLADIVGCGYIGMLVQRATMFYVERVDTLYVKRMSECRMEWLVCC